MTTISRYHGTISATIASSASLSGAVEISTAPILALYIPSGWTTAAMTFQGSVDGGTTYASVFDDSGVEVQIASTSINTAAAQVIVNASVLEKLAGLQFIKIRSGTSGSPVTQTAAITIVIGVKG